MPTLFVLEDPPELGRPRWYCHLDGNLAPPFEEADEAVEWARSRSFDVVIRTLGGLYFTTPAAASDWDGLFWPPTRAQRQTMDADYQKAVADAEFEAAAQAAYEAEREQLFGPDADLEVRHSGVLELEDSQTSLLVDELSDDAQLSGGRRRGTTETSFGALPDVIAQLAHLGKDDPWVAAVLASLARERGGRTGRGTWRRPVVTVRGGAGTMYHASDPVNRTSISDHGLSWARMSSPGIAGSRSPECEGVFLCENEREVDFFVKMARKRGVAADVWSVNVDGYWIENGPEGWWIIFETIPPDRVRLKSP